MLPYVETGSRIKDDFASLVALCRGRYLIDTDRTIDRLAQKFSTVDRSFVCTGIKNSATLRQLLRTISRVEAELVVSADHLEARSDEILNCRDVLYSTVHSTTTRLRNHALAAIAFLIFSFAMLLVDEVVAGLVSLAAVVAFVFAFIDELDTRSVELGDQFDYLYTLCRRAARETIDLVLREKNFQFFCDVIERRYGDVPDGQDDELMDLDEPYDPDVELPYTM